MRDSLFIGLWRVCQFGSFPDWEGTTCRCLVSCSVMYSIGEELLMDNLIDVIGNCLPELVISIADSNEPSLTVLIVGRISGQIFFQNSRNDTSLERV